MNDPPLKGDRTRLIPRTRLTVPVAQSGGHRYFCMGCLETDFLMELNLTELARWFRALPTVFRDAVVIGAILLAVAQPCAADHIQESFPYELDSWVEGALVTGGVGLVAAGRLVRHRQDPMSAGAVALLDRADINSFDRSATSQWSVEAAAASDVLGMTLLAAPVGLAIATSGSRESWVVSAMYGEVFLVGNGLVDLLKGVTNRTRPLVYNGHPDIPAEARFDVKARRAFPSGHTANAFASAVFFSSVFTKLHPNSSAGSWIWASSVTLAAATGFARYQGGKHYPTDLLIGAFVGSLVGWGVPRLHEIDGVSLAVSPSENGTKIGLRLRH
jgi:membrane-associated phospholipid phosphatase